MKGSFRRFTTATKQSFRSRIVLGTGVVLSTGALGYLLWNKQKKAIPSKLSKLPHLDQFLSQEEIDSIWEKNEESFRPKRSISRIDLNSIASNNPSEDGYSIQEFNKGILIGIYDGHGGGECVKVVQDRLTSYVAQYLKKSGTRREEIKQAIKNAFVAFDHDLINGAIQPYPVSHWMNPFYLNYGNILRNLKCASSGACAIVAYINDKDVYVACLGDSRAVLGRKRNYSHEGVELYQAIELSKDQTARTPSEFARLCEEHPGEEDSVVVRGRILGGLQPSRAFGDARYKWTRDIQEVLIPKLYPDGRRTIPTRLKTPPYVISRPEVTHYERDAADSFLILACDGLWDELSSEKSVEVVSKYLEDKYQENFATTLMKAGISGYEVGNGLLDHDRIQHNLSIPSPLSRRYRDDMTVCVAFFERLDDSIPKVDSRGKEMDPVPAFESPSSPQLKKWVQALRNHFQSKL